MNSSAFRCRYCAGQRGQRQYETLDQRGTTYELMRCERCCGFSLWPPPGEEALRHAYGDAYYSTEKGKFGGTVGRVFRCLQRRRAKRFARKLQPGVRVLDVGCGRGHFLADLAELGFNCAGTELSESSARWVEQLEGVQVYTGEDATRRFEDESFAGICIWHVLEHLDSPAACLDEVDRLLAPGGVLLIAVPNIQSLQSRLFGGAWFHLDPPRHLYLPDAEFLNAELARRGIEPLEQKHFSLEYNLLGFIQSLFNLFFSPRDQFYESLKSGAERRRPRILLQTALCALLLPAAAILAGLEASLRRGGTVEYWFCRPAEPAN